MPDLSQLGGWPPIAHEADCEPREMTAEESAAYREYMDHRPDDPEERARLRRIFRGANPDEPTRGMLAIILRPWHRNEWGEYLSQRALVIGWRR